MFFALYWLPMRLTPYIFSFVIYSRTTRGEREGDKEHFLAYAHASMYVYRQKQPCSCIHFFSAVGARQHL